MAGIMVAAFAVAQLGLPKGRVDEIEAGAPAPSPA